MISAAEFLPRWATRSPGFTPRAVKRFEGVVYRGMSRPPKTIFIQGLSEKETSAAYEDYLKTATGSVGVSTSKCFKTAMKYTQNHRRTGDERYVYQIHYRGRGGFDVFETIKARGLQVAGLFGYQRRHAQEKAEVNIRGCVPSADIVGAYRVGEQSTLQWLGNPQYQASTP